MSTETEPDPHTVRTPPEEETPGVLQHTSTKQWGFIKIRTDHDFEHQDWWVASIAIPLLAATLAPLANVLSISALVSYWRTDLRPPGGTGDPLPQLSGNSIPDPHWVYGLNLASLITGYAGNLFLLMNFTNRIRYIIALPATIILWYVSTATLIAIQISMNTYEPPQPPYQVYSQAFWYGVIAAILYLLCSMMLMVNMVGFFLGHYPQKFNLTDSQRTLILQTFLFFIWLAGGAAVYSRLETEYGHGSGWGFSDALYFCDVTILTVGFGDLVPTENIGRGLLIPYAIGGVIMLGLMVSSITAFGKEITQANIVQKRANKARLRTLEKSRRRRESSVNPEQLRQGVEELRKSLALAQSPFNTEAEKGDSTSEEHHNHARPMMRKIHRKGTEVLHAMQGKGSHDKDNDFNKSHDRHVRIPGMPPRKRRRSAVALKEERDRFNAMRKIQYNNAKFKEWTALGLSTTVLCFVWFVGALVFWVVEREAQHMTYFESVYFCFTALTTIGYGSFAPATNAGRPFFVVWSLIAIPSITILISNMADTVVVAFKKGTENFAAFTLLPEHGIWRRVLNNNPWLLVKVKEYEDHKAAEKRVAEGFEAGPAPDNTGGDESEAAVNSFLPKTIEQLVKQQEVDEHELAHNLSLAIRKTAEDLRAESEKRYGYEEWAEFTTLIRFTRVVDPDEDDSEEGLIDWDWIGENSPMMADKSEPEWLLDRLCESMGRYVRHQRHKKRKGKTVEERALAEQARAELAFLDGSHHDRFEREDEEDSNDNDNNNDDNEDSIERGDWSGSTSGSSPTLRNGSGN